MFKLIKNNFSDIIAISLVTISVMGVLALALDTNLDKLKRQRGELRNMQTQTLSEIDATKEQIKAKDLELVELNASLLVLQDQLKDTELFIEDVNEKIIIEVGIKNDTKVIDSESPGLATEK